MLGKVLGQYRRQLMRMSPAPAGISQSNTMAPGPGLASFHSARGARTAMASVSSHFVMAWAESAAWPWLWFSTYRRSAATRACSMGESANASFLSSRRVVVALTPGR